jgi:hypothetical protein
MVSWRVVKSKGERASAIGWSLSLYDRTVGLSPFMQRCKHGSRQRHGQEFLWQDTPLIVTS